MSRTPRLAGPGRTGLPKLLALLVIATALLVWLWQGREPERPEPGASTPTPPAVATGDPATADVDRTTQRDLVVDAAATGDGDEAAAAGPTLRVRLRGLVPAAPWTTELKIDFEGRDKSKDIYGDHEDRVEVAADGTAEFLLPSWVTEVTRRKLRIDAEDPNYRPTLVRLRDGAIDLDAELVIDVQAIGVLTGRVVDIRGEPVIAARVTAFAFEDGRLAPGELGTTTTSIEGRYHLEAAPDTPLSVVVVPMREAQISGRFLTGRHGAIADLGIPRADLLPTSVRATAALGSQGSLPDIVVGDAATVRGVVQFRDGRPIEKIKIVAMRAGRAAGSPSSRVSPNVDLGVRRDGTLDIVSTTWSDDDGRFEFAAAPGERLDLYLAEVPGMLLYHGMDQAVATTDPAPTTARVELPLPVRLRAMLAGSPATNATVRLRHGEPVACDDAGEVRLVTTQNVRVRAIAGRRSSPWTTVTASQSGTIVPLALDAEKTAVFIELEGEVPIRNAIFRWREGTRDQLEPRQRGDDSGPFCIYLPPGRHEVLIGPGPGERNGQFLLPQKQTIDVGTTDLRLSFPVKFGGRLQLHLTDATGRHIGETCRIFGPDGQQIRGMLSVDVDGIPRPGRALNRLPESGPATFGPLLAPGDYDVLLTFAGHPDERRTVRIQPREVTELHLRLP